MPRPRTLRALLGLTLVAAGAVAPAYAPVSAGLVSAAAAATCADASGVSVVVDHRELGGGVVTGCARTGGGRSAAAIFAEAGVSISYATRQPGFVCRVNGVPASDPCVNTSPADAFWGLWWSDGSGGWTYSSQSVQGLTVPAGGTVAWAWQQDRPTGSPSAPTVAPATPPRAPSASPTATATPTQAPTKSPTKSPTRTPGPSTTEDPTTAPGASGSPDPTSSPVPTSSTSPRETPTLPAESPSDSAATAPTLAPESPSDSTATTAPGDTPESAAPATDEPIDDPARVPGWLAWGLVVLLAVAVGASALLTRRRRGGPDAAA